VKRKRKILTPAPVKHRLRRDLGYDKGGAGGRATPELRGYRGGKGYGISRREGTLEELVGTLGLSWF